MVSTKQPPNNIYDAAIAKTQRRLPRTLLPATEMNMGIRQMKRCMMVPFKQERGLKFMPTCRSSPTQAAARRCMLSLDYPVTPCIRLETFRASHYAEKEKQSLYLYQSSSARTMNTSPKMHDILLLSSLLLHMIVHPKEFLSA
jgi:hypothetical protein